MTMMYNKETPPADVQDDPEARELLRRAFEKTARWPADFNGFSADLTINVDGREFAGTVTVKPAQDVTVSLPDAEVQKWVTGTISMIAVHRAHRTFDQADGKSVLTLDRSSSHPLGQTLIVTPGCGWAQREGGPVEEIRPEQAPSYGVIQYSRQDDRVFPIDDLVEKPSVDDAPSDLALLGRYILTPKIFDKLEQTQRGAGGEIQLTDAISALLLHERVLALRLPGRRFDCGSKLGYLEAMVEYGLRHPEIGEDFARYLKSR